MAVNLYDSPAKADFINYYSPIPFKELNQAAQSRQGKLDRNLASLDEAEAAVANLGYIPNSVDQATVENWQREMSQFADSYMDKDLSDPVVTREMKRKFRQLIDPNEVKQTQQSFAGYNAYQKQAAQMQAKGQQVYNPKDFTGYNTLDAGSGVFAGQPIMDLGAQAEAAINRFMTKPERKSGEVTLPSGRIAIERKRDINEIESLIDTEDELGALLNDPAIQQLMEREGLDVEGFKQSLKDRAPSYVQQDYTSVSGFRDPEGPEETPEYTNPATSSGDEFARWGLPNKRGKYKDINAQTVEEIIPNINITKEDGLVKSAKKDIAQKKADIEEVKDDYFERIRSAESDADKDYLRTRREQEIKEINDAYKESGSGYDIKINVFKKGKERRKIQREYFPKIRDAATNEEADRLIVERDSKVKQMEESFKKTSRTRISTMDELSPEDQAQYNELLGGTVNYFEGEDVTSLPIDEQLAKMDEYIHHIGTRGISPSIREYGASFRPEESKVLTTQDKLLSTLDNRPIYDPTKHVGQELESTKSLKTKYPPGDIYEWNLIGETADIPHPEFGLAKQVSITKKAGGDIGTFFIGGSFEESASADWDHKLAMIQHEYIPHGKYATYIPGVNAPVTIEWKRKDNQDPNIGTSYAVKVIGPDGDNWGEFEGNSTGSITQQFLQSLSN